MVGNLQNSEHYKDKNKSLEFYYETCSWYFGIILCVYFVSHLEHAICKLLCSINYKSIRISSNY